MMFIELTLPSQKRITVNANAIATVYEDENGNTIVEMVAGAARLVLTEPYLYVVKKIDNAVNLIPNRLAAAFCPQ